MIAFTWTRWHCTPANAPARHCISSISTEEKVDHVARTFYGWQHRCIVFLASDHDAVVREGAAALLHQGCPISVHDCQVVEATSGMGRVRPNFKCGES